MVFTFIMATQIPATKKASGPHAPGPRTLLAVLPGGWEVRGFAPADPRVSFALGRGFWHVQLYEPCARLSVLTPSRLTDGWYEVSTPRHALRHALDEDDVARLVAHARSPIDATALREVRRRFVDDVERAYRRGERVACA